MTGTAYPAAVLDAGARALCTRTGALGSFDKLEPSYRRDLEADVAAVLDACFVSHLAGLVADELDRRLASRSRAAAVRDADSEWLTFNRVTP